MKAPDLEKVPFTSTLLAKMIFQKEGGIKNFHFSFLKKFKNSFFFFLPIQSLVDYSIVHSIMKRIMFLIRQWQAIPFNKFKLRIFRHRKDMMYHFCLNRNSVTQTFLAKIIMLTHYPITELLPLLRFQGWSDRFVIHLKPPFSMLKGIGL
ncbi:hypothetical protein PNI0006_00043 [Streptococcus pneumoniae PNI0006]|nr:hypothetical protein PNI0006_00043 [Streptococcus pneumoniae PNI0006]